MCFPGSPQITSAYTGDRRLRRTKEAMVQTNGRRSERQIEASKKGLKSVFPTECSFFFRRKFKMLKMKIHRGV